MKTVEDLFKSARCKSEFRLIAQLLTLAAASGMASVDDESEVVESVSRALAEYRALPEVA